MKVNKVALLAAAKAAWTWPKGHNGAESYKPGYAFIPHTPEGEMKYG